MTRFHFIHAADIHLDSPLHGLARYEGLPADEVRGATRAAFDNLIQRACDEAVDFMLIAGDLFDGDWKDMGTGLYFARAMAKLAAADIPAFLLAGNHDAASVLTRQLPWPDNVRLFNTRRPQTHMLDHLGVAIHGQSFANAQVLDNLAAAYPAARENHFNIGMLHTALTGHEGHAPYAPCTIQDLTAKGYDYWALGHVHEHAVLGERPHIIFPGNLQGRHIRETGPKGAVLVEVQDRTVVGFDHIPLDVVRWAQVEADCTGARNLDDVNAATRAALAHHHAQQSDGRAVIARVTLTGRTALAGLLRDRQTVQRDEVRALAAAIAPDLWIEKLRVTATPPDIPATEAATSDDFLALLAEAAATPDLAEALSQELRPFLAAAAKALDEQGDGPAGLAARGDWTALLSITGTALNARLAGAETE
ncbi:metallophosphoesterase family protein [Niveispirillum sp. KHB5.9]|uniref:metallophosphoesterase family protein n=1 Tax=Niveispirillum sp. KHB5.9 TaxID=3400269 RepID=UPI003A8C2BE2